MENGKAPAERVLQGSGGAEGGRVRGEAGGSGGGTNGEVRPPTREIHRNGRHLKRGTEQSPEYAGTKVRRHARGHAKLAWPPARRFATGKADDKVRERGASTPLPAAKRGGMAWQQLLRPRRHATAFLKTPSQASAPIVERPPQVALRRLEIGAAATQQCVCPASSGGSSPECPPHLSHVDNLLPQTLVDALATASFGNPNLDLSSGSNGFALTECVSSPASVKATTTIKHGIRYYRPTFEIQVVATTWISPFGVQSEKSSVVIKGTVAFNDPILDLDDVDGVNVDIIGLAEYICPPCTGGPQVCMDMQAWCTKVLNRGFLKFQLASAEMDAMLEKLLPVNEELYPFSFPALTQCSITIAKTEGQTASQTSDDTFVASLPSVVDIATKDGIFLSATLPLDALHPILVCSVVGAPTVCAHEIAAALDLTGYLQTAPFTNPGLSDGDFIRDQLEKSSLQVTIKDALGLAVPRTDFRGQLQAVAGVMAPLFLPSEVLSTLGAIAFQTPLTAPAGFAITGLSPGKLRAAFNFTLGNRSIAGIAEVKPLTQSTVPAISQGVAVLMTTTVESGPQSESANAFAEVPFGISGMHPPEIRVTGLRHFTEFSSSGSTLTALEDGTSAGHAVGFLQFTVGTAHRKDTSVFNFEALARELMPINGDFPFTLPISTATLTIAKSGGGASPAASQANYVHAAATLTDVLPTELQVASRDGLWVTAMQPMNAPYAGLLACSVMGSTATCHLATLEVTIYMQLEDSGRLANSWLQVGGARAHFDGSVSTTAATADPLFLPAHLLSSLGSVAFPGSPLSAAAFAITGVIQDPTDPKLQAAYELKLGSVSLPGTAVIELLEVKGLEGTKLYHDGVLVFMTTTVVFPEKIMWLAAGLEVKVTTLRQFTDVTLSPDGISGDADKGHSLGFFQFEVPTVSLDDIAENLLGVNSTTEYPNGYSRKGFAFGLGDLRDVTFTIAMSSAGGESLNDFVANAEKPSISENADPTFAQLAGVLPEELAHVHADGVYFSARVSLGYVDASLRRLVCSTVGQYDPVDFGTSESDYGACESDQLDITGYIRTDGATDEDNRAGSWIQATYEEEYTFARQGFNFVPRFDANEGSQPFFINFEDLYKSSFVPGQDIEIGGGIALSYLNPHLNVDEFTPENGAEYSEMSVGASLFGEAEFEVGDSIYPVDTTVTWLEGEDGELGVSTLFEGFEFGSMRAFGYQADMTARVHTACLMSRFPPSTIEPCSNIYQHGQVNIGDASLGELLVAAGLPFNARALPFDFPRIQDSSLTVARQRSGLISEEYYDTAYLPDDLAFASRDGMYLKFPWEPRSEIISGMLCMIPTLAGLPCETRAFETIIYIDDSPLYTSYADGWLDECYVTFEMPGIDPGQLNGMPLLSVGGGSFTIQGFGSTHEVYLYINNMMLMLPSCFPLDDPSCWTFGPFDVTAMIIAFTDGTTSYIQFEVKIDLDWEAPLGIPLVLHSVGFGARATITGPNGPSFALIATAEATVGPLTFAVGVQIGVPNPSADSGLFLQLNKVTLYELAEFAMELAGNADGSPPEVLKDMSFFLQMCITSSSVNFHSLGQEGCDRGAHLIAEIELFVFTAVLEASMELDDGGFGGLSASIELIFGDDALYVLIDAIADILSMGLSRALVTAVVIGLRIFLSTLMIERIKVGFEAPGIDLQFELDVKIFGRTIELRCHPPDISTIVSVLRTFGPGALADAIGFEMPTLADLLTSAMDMVKNVVQFTCEDGVPTSGRGVTRSCTLAVLGGLLHATIGVSIDICKENLEGSYAALSIYGEAGAVGFTTSWVSNALERSPGNFESPQVAVHQTSIADAIKNFIGDILAAPFQQLSDSWLTGDNLAYLLWPPWLILDVIPKVSYMFEGQDTETQASVGIDVCFKLGLQVWLPTGSKSTFPWVDFDETFLGVTFCLSELERFVKKILSFFDLGTYLGDTLVGVLEVAGMDGLLDKVGDFGIKVGDAFKSVLDGDGSVFSDPIYQSGPLNLQDLCPQPKPPGSPPSSPPTPFPPPSPPPPPPLPPPPQYTLQMYSEGEVVLGDPDDCSGALKLWFTGEVDLTLDLGSPLYGYVDASLSHEGGWSPLCGAAAEAFRLPRVSGAMEWGRSSSHGDAYATLSADVEFNRTIVILPNLLTITRDPRKPKALGPSASIDIGINKRAYVVPPSPPPDAASIANGHGACLAFNVGRAVATKCNTKQEVEKGEESRDQFWFFDFYDQSGEAEPAGVLSTEQLDLIGSVYGLSLDVMGRIRNAASGKCLSVRYAFRQFKSEREGTYTGAHHDGAPAIEYPCDASPAGSVIKAASGCLTRERDPGNDLTFYVLPSTCPGGGDFEPAQLWYFDELGRMPSAEDPSQCLTTRGSEAQLVMADCGTADNFLWALDSNGNLRADGGTGNCVTDRGPLQKFETSFCQDLLASSAGTDQESTQQFSFSGGGTAASLWGFDSTGRLRNGINKCLGVEKGLGSSQKDRSNPHKLVVYNCVEGSHRGAMLVRDERYERYANLERYERFANLQSQGLCMAVANLDDCRKGTRIAYSCGVVQRRCSPELPEVLGQTWRFDGTGRLVTGDRTDFGLQAEFCLTTVEKPASGGGNFAALGTGRIAQVLACSGMEQSGMGSNANTWEDGSATWALSSEGQLVDGSGLCMFSLEDSHKEGDRLYADSCSRSMHLTSQSWTLSVPGQFSGGGRGAQSTVDQQWRWYDRRNRLDKFRDALSVGVSFNGGLQLGSTEVGTEGALPWLSLAGSFGQAAEATLSVSSSQAYKVLETKFVTLTLETLSGTFTMNRHTGAVGIEIAGGGREISIFEQRSFATITDWHVELSWRGGTNAPNNPLATSFRGNIKLWNGLEATVSGQITDSGKATLAAYHAGGWSPPALGNMAEVFKTPSMNGSIVIGSSWDEETSQSSDLKMFMHARYQSPLAIGLSLIGGEKTPIAILSGIDEVDGAFVHDPNRGPEATLDLRLYPRQGGADLRGAYKIRYGVESSFAGVGGGCMTVNDDGYVVQSGGGCQYDSFALASESDPSSGKGGRTFLGQWQHDGKRLKNTRTGLCLAIAHKKPHKSEWDATDGTPTDAWNPRLLSDVASLENGVPAIEWTCGASKDQEWTFIDASLEAEAAMQTANGHAETAKTAVGYGLPGLLQNGNGLCLAAAAVNDGRTSGIKVQPSHSGVEGLVQYDCAAEPQGSQISSWAGKCLTYLASADLVVEMACASASQGSRGDPSQLWRFDGYGYLRNEADDFAKCLYAGNKCFDQWQNEYAPRCVCAGLTGDFVGSLETVLAMTPECRILGKGCSCDSMCGALESEEECSAMTMPELTGQLALCNWTPIEEAEVINWPPEEHSDCRADDPHELYMRECEGVWAQGSYQWSMYKSPEASANTRHLTNGLGSCAEGGQASDKVHAAICRGSRSNQVWGFKTTRLDVGIDRKWTLLPQATNAYKTIQGLKQDRKLVVAGALTLPNMPSLPTIGVSCTLETGALSHCNLTTFSEWTPINNSLLRLTVCTVGARSLSSALSLSLCLLVPCLEPIYICMHTCTSSTHLRIGASTHRLHWNRRWQIRGRS